MPYYRPIGGPSTTLCVGDDAWHIDGQTETPEMPVAEELVAQGSWEKSDKPFPASKPKAMKLPEPAASSTVVDPEAHTKKVLATAAVELGLDSSGTKVDIAARLSAHEGGAAAVASAESL